MLCFQEVRKRFGPIVAVDDLSVDIQPGEVFGLLGPNGAGKTTTVHLAVGLLQPDGGSVTIQGLGAPTSPRVRRMIGVAPQALAVYDEFSAEDNLRFFGRVYGLSGRKLSQRVGWTLEFVGLAERRKQQVKTFSGGMKRRLNLAVALVHDPALLLLDEPTVGVDTQSRQAIFDNIARLREQGRTIVYTTHYMEEAQRLCDRVGIIDRGRLLALDSVDGLIQRYGGKRLLIAQRGDEQLQIETDDPLAELIRLHDEDRLTGFRVETPDLEHVFLNLTGRHLRD